MDCLCDRPIPALQVTRDVPATAACRLKVSNASTATLVALHHHGRWDRPTGQKLTLQDIRLELTSLVKAAVSTIASVISIPPVSWAKLSAMAGFV
jgi:hypothetical protein